MTLLWTEKYRPSKISEIAGNKDAVAEFMEWIEGWLKRRQSKKAALLYGPAGVGKTSLVHAYAKEHGWEVIEMNASDFRTRENVERIVGAASSQDSITAAKGKVILIDEVDGIEARADAGAVQTLVQIVAESHVPIVMVANDPWDPKLAPLREICQMIQFRRIPKPTVAAHIKKITMAEGLKIPEEKIKEIAENSDGDLRSAINDLQIYASALDTGLEVGSRDRKNMVFNALATVFHAKSFNNAVYALNNLDLDPAEFFTWVLDNAPEQLSPHDLAKALENLSKADLFLQRVNSKQAWHLLRYAVPFMTAGVALARKQTPAKFVKFSYPSRISYLSRTRGERELVEDICSKLGKALHMSSRKARTEALPFVKIMLSSNGKRLAEFFGFTEKEVQYMRQRQHPQPVSRPSHGAAASKRAVKS
ncbi:MAG: replication factor C large subunit [Candidatus Caldarchaeum sp.]